MQALVKYLQKHIAGEVLSGAQLVKAFSRDGSLVAKVPLAVIFARDEKDIRKTLLFLSQAAVKGSRFTLTVRGGGSDLSGAAVTTDLLLVLPAYMNQVLSFDSRRRLYRAQAGISAQTLNQFLNAGGHYLPPIQALPASSTLGGAVANNSYGRYSWRYGLMSKNVVGLKVILANGEVLEIKSLSLTQLRKKLSQETFEGDIYRELYRLFYQVDSAYYYKTSDLFWRKDNQLPRQLSVYDLSRVCTDKGELNLIPLFCGSQATLGVISEVVFQAEIHNPLPQVVLLRCKNIVGGLQILEKLQALGANSATLINGACFQKLRQIHPYLLNDFTDLEQAEATLIVEFDDFNRGRCHRKIRKLLKQTAAFGIDGEMIHPPELYDNIDRLRSALTAIFAQPIDKRQYILAGFWGSYVPVVNMALFYEEAQALFKQARVDFLVWGEVGLGNLNILTNLNLQTTYGQRKWHKLQQDYGQLLNKHQGRLHISNQEGLLLGTRLHQHLSPADFQLLKSLKVAFDPYNLLNPAIKLGAEDSDLNQHLQASHDWHRFYDKYIYLT